MILQRIFVGYKSDLRDIYERVCEYNESGDLSEFKDVTVENRKRLFAEKEFLYWYIVGTMDGKVLIEGRGKDESCGTALQGIISALEYIGIDYEIGEDCYFSNQEFKEFCEKNNIEVK